MGKPASIQFPLDGASRTVYTLCDYLRRVSLSLERLDLNAFFPVQMLVPSIFPVTFFLPHVDAPFLCL